MNEDRTTKRSSDLFKTWASILGPVFGLVFGFGVAKATIDGKIGQNSDRISSIEGRLQTLETNSARSSVDYATAISGMKEQVFAMNRRMERMEDLLERTLYTVSKASKQK